MHFCDSKGEFSAFSLQCHMILQKSFYADLLLKKHLSNTLVQFSLLISCLLACILLSVYPLPKLNYLTNY